MHNPPKNDQSGNDRKGKVVVVTFFIRGNYSKNDFENAGIFANAANSTIEVTQIDASTKLVVKNAYFMAIVNVAFALGAAGYGAYSTSLYFEKPEERTEITERIRSMGLRPLRGGLH